MVDRESFGTVSLITQGQHKFYTLTMPSEVLARTCFVVSRDEDPIEGFQRILDEKRANEIANYIDNGLGTVPSSIVLSAQEDADLEYDSRRKTISFKPTRRAFLIIDGQHRVYGFSKARTNLRVPVVIYDELNKREESRLFIDINSKQKGVPSELLLDIKKLAEYESDVETRLRIIFDRFMGDSASIFFGKLSPSKKSPGKLTRTAFNSSVTPLVSLFSNIEEDEVYDILSSYYQSIFDALFLPKNLENEFYQPTVFKAVSAFFPTVARRVKDK
ncbi:MAG: DGQHR domain-containing protein [Oceanicaulis sp.]